MFSQNTDAVFICCGRTITSQEIKEINVTIEIANDKESVALFNEFILWQIR